jgi:hypothetical protein
MPERRSKVPAPDPQFAVERRLRQTVGEPTRGVDLLAAAEAEGLTVPDGAHAIELFADEVLCEIDLIAINLGEEDGRRFG